MKVKIILDDILNSNGIGDYKDLTEKKLLSTIKNKYKCSKYLAQKVIESL